MAFFKFRLPGNSGAAAAEAQASSATESLEVIRRRARHRLMGAVVLVFVAVVAFPLLFDSQPRPVAVDTPILIPERASTPPLAAGAAVPAAQAPAQPLLPAASTALPAQAGLEQGKEEVVSGPAKAQGAGAATASPDHSQTQTQAPAEKSPLPAAKPEPKEKQTAKAADDGQKARALLEGKSGPAESAERVIIQVGAFADAEKVREVRRKLEQAGLKTYTQTIDGKDGKTTTRIRLGPFESRAEAEKAAARVRKLDLPASLITL